MSARVLFVDDDAQMRSSTAQALELAGFAVEALASGDEALALAGPGFAGVIVSDIRMPGMDGMTLLNRLHEVDPDLPVILVTGHAEVPLAVEAIRAAPMTSSKSPLWCRIWPMSSAAPSNIARWCWKTAGCAPSPASATILRRACPAAPRAWSICATGCAPSARPTRMR